MSEINEKYVTVKRLHNIYAKMNNRPSMMNESFKNNVQKLSAPLNRNGGGSINTGLTREEKSKLMSEQLGMSPDDREFYKRVDMFYADLEFAIPEEGLKLNISTNKNGDPVEIIDYLKYKICTVLPKVADSALDVNDLVHEYFIEDEAALDDKALTLVTKRKEANKIFTNLADENVPLFLYLLKSKGVKELDTVNIDALSAPKKYINLESMVSKYPEYFIDIAKDLGTAKNPGDAVIKYLIERLITYNLLERAGNDILYNTENLGNMKHAIAWFKNAKNSQERAVLEAKLDGLVLEKSK